MSEITINLRLAFKIPDSGLRINGLIQGLKESSSEIHQTILTTLMKALEKQAMERLLQKDPERYGRNGHQSKSRHLKCSLGTISYRFAQVVDRRKDRSLTPLAEALSIPAYEHYLDDALEPSIGLSIHVFFRRATSEIERIQGQCMNHTTVHSRLQKFAHEHNPLEISKGSLFSSCWSMEPKSISKGPQEKTWVKSKCAGPLLHWVLKAGLNPSVSGSTPTGRRFEKTCKGGSTIKAQNPLLRWRARDPRKSPAKGDGPSALSLEWEKRVSLPPLCPWSQKS